MASKTEKVDRNPAGGLHYNAFFTIGCDPELFIQDKNGEIVGSERVIPARGIGVGYNNSNKVVRDGVQIELHPEPTTCRASVGNYIQQILRELDATIRNNPEFKDKYRVSFADVVTVKKKELQSLSKECRMLGCAPSLNLYRPSRIRVNPETYTKRSAGGHIHISGFDRKMLSTPKNVRDLIFMFDAFVGNTCVLIDRSPHAITRRRVYGRAGEYRLPTWGVEYRTLSNFWMRSYQLFSLVSGLMRMGASASQTSYTRTTYTPYLTSHADVQGMVLDSLDPKRVQRAINRNDLDLAYRNWEDLKPIIKGYYTKSLTTYEGICSASIPYFEFFAQKVQEHAASGESKANGLDFWFPDDPMKHWIKKAEGHGTGWETFVARKVTPMYLKSLQEKKDANTNQAAA